MRYINPRFTYLLTYLLSYNLIQIGTKHLLISKHNTYVFGVAESNGRILNNATFDRHRQHKIATGLETGSSFNLG